MTANAVRMLAVGLAVVLGVVFWVSRQGAAGNERPEERGTVAGFTTYAVPSSNFTIAVPESWRTFTAEEVFGSGDDLDRFVRENPTFGALADALSNPGSPIKLIAVDPDVRGAFATNLNVVVNSVPEGFSLDDFARQAESEIKRFGYLSGDIQRESVQLRAGKAERLSYLGEFTMEGRSRSMAFLQYGLVADGRSYVLTFTTLPELADGYRDDFERSALSFDVG